MDITEYRSLVDLLMQPYESLLASLRLPLSDEIRERVQEEIRSRDRAAYNQRVQVCGGEFK